MDRRLEERLVEWKDATLRGLQRKWWLWPLILVLALLQDRFLTSINKVIDQYAGGLGGWLLAPISDLLRSPVVFAVILGVVIIIALTVHAYVETRSGSVATAAAPQLGPRLVIEYCYEESSKDWPQRSLNSDPEAPLVIRNVDPQRAAYNVKLLALTVEGKTVKFAPELIPSVEPNGRAQVFAKILGAGPLGKKQLPMFFRQFYNDKSIEELMTDKVYTLMLEYDDGSDTATAHFTECQLSYRRWKDRIEMRAVHGYSRQRISE